jgi:hypothetical protein
MPEKVVATEPSATNSGLGRNGRPLRIAVGAFVVAAVAVAMMLAARVRADHAKGAARAAARQELRVADHDGGS